MAQTNEATWRRADDLPADAVPAYVEVTDTLGVPYVTGIQRIVRELLAAWPVDVRVQPVPVVHTGTSFRWLTDDEAQRLRGEPPGPPGGVANRLRTTVRRVPGARPVYRWLRRRAHERAERDRTHLHCTPRAGDLFFDLEASWWSPAPRAVLLPELRRRGVRVATLVYDLLLLRYPEWFDPENREVFEPWAQAQLAHSELVVVYSDFCAGEVAYFGGPDAPLTVRFLPGAGPASPISSRPAAVPDDLPFVVSVSTIEPRKNVDTLLSAMERVWAGGEPTRLVLVGRRGWNVEELVARLTRHPERGRRLIWMGWASDAEVDWLYRHAAAVAVPSWAEGYGLPVVEGLRRGARVLSSTGGALREVGGDGVVRLDPGDVDAWASAIVDAVAAGRPSDPEVPPDARVTWEDAARTIAGHLERLAKS